MTENIDHSEHIILFRSSDKWPWHIYMNNKGEQILSKTEARSTAKSYKDKHEMKVMILEIYKRLKGF